VNVEQLKRHCSEYRGARSKLLGAPWNVLLYQVDDRQFAYFKTSEPERWRFSFRTNPERFLELTGVPGIKPARYMGRFHWVTIVDVRSVPAGYLRELVAWSHAKALSGLSKKRQSVIMGDA
jgi:predicted DNA-binding protein (MmcQ/YjbR family)